jgi:bacterioferritin-associated ferredoxin
MYICNCNALTDKQIAAVVAAGADRPHDVYAACGCRAQCGGCTATILSMVRAGACSAGK